MRKLLAVVLVILAGVGSWIWWLGADMQRVLNSPLNLTSEQRLMVEPGMTLTRLSRELEHRGWIEHGYYLLLDARLNRRTEPIKAGEFAVRPGTTPLQLLELLVSGRVVQHSLTLVEGWTVAEILAAVRASPDLVHTLDSDNPSRVMSAIGRAGYFAEGRFFPDTYRFPLGTTDLEFLRRACLTQEQTLAEEWVQRMPGLPYASPYQALIMASLVEKETAVAAERPMIAGVFVRRLQRGMKLQTDPTLIYALGTGFDGDIRSRDLDAPSAYNTYLHPGLPPTPIAAAGRASIRAALQPEAGDALYFVARGDGSHEFSATLEEHNRAVRKYQLGKE